jgi:simple sugar transport system ATP-binding protein
MSNAETAGETHMETRDGALMRTVNIRKRFGYVEVLKGINLLIGNNEIVGLVGDNGAGKSTLIKILTGVYAQDSGELYWKGQPLLNHSVPKARDIGIMTVFQDKAIVEQHSIWRNIFMGREITGALGFIKIRKERQETTKLMQGMMGFTSSMITPDTVLGNMSGGEKQGVAISRALYFDADLIILDEPTTGLSLSETRKVLSFVNAIKGNGKSCIFITHNLFHVYAVADRIVALDRGEIVGSFPTGEIGLEEMEEKMLAIASTGRAEEVQFRHRRQGGGSSGTSPEGQSR